MLLTRDYSAEFLNRKFLKMVTPVCLAIAAGILYVATLDTGLQPHELHGGDLITHQYAQVQGRPGNAPGYPIYTMGGWLWFHSLRLLLKQVGIVHPNPIPLLSSYSTIWALASLAMLFHVIHHVLLECQPCYARTVIALLVSLFFAVTYFFWYYATTTEQYSSAIAQTLAIVLTYLQWRRGPPVSLWLWTLAFLSGLSLAHMLTVAFIVPPLVAVMLWQHPQLIRNGKAIVGSALAALIPLVSYLYVWWRGATHPEWWGTGSWSNAQSWFWSFVSTAQGRDELMRSFEPGRDVFGNGFPKLIWQELSVPMLLVGLIGLVLLEKRLRWLAIGTIVLYGIFCWSYRFGNWFQVILPAYPLVLLGTANAIARFSYRVRKWLASTLSRDIVATGWIVHTLVVITIGGAVSWRFAQSWPAADSRDRPGDTALAEAAILLDQPLPAGSGLFANVDNSLALDYLIEIWQIRSDVTTVSSPLAAQYLAEGRDIAATWSALPTLLSELPNEIVVRGMPISPDWILLQAVDGEIVSTHRDTVQRKMQINREILPGVILVDMAIEAAPDGAPVLNPGQHALDVTLYWQITNDQWPADVSISVRPTQKGMGIPVQDEYMQHDRRQPMQEQLKAHKIQTQDLLVDPYRFDLSLLRTGVVDGISVILYRRQGNQFENLARVDLPVAPPCP